MIDAADGGAVTGLLEGLPVGNLGAGAIVCLIVLLILTGRLVPRQQMLDLREDRDKWRSSAEDQLKALHTLGMAVERLTIATTATNHALVEIQDLPNRVAESGS